VRSWKRIVEGHGKLWQIFRGKVWAPCIIVEARDSTDVEFSVYDGDEGVFEDVVNNLDVGKVLKP